MKKPTVPQFVAIWYEDNQDDFEIIQTDSTLYISVYDFLYNIYIYLDS